MTYCHKYRSKTLRAEKEQVMMKSKRYEIARKALIEKRISMPEYEALLDAIDALYRKPVR